MKESANRDSDKTNDTRFNETVQRMLKTPPRSHHEEKHKTDQKTQKSKNKAEKPE
ncbi:hypothetical protein NKI32_16450 [Mesorhizobium sp. M0761]|uniref:hypothetical protein n=1 Tax=Mesorhizobium sp. M0761 TaxID=2956994 RepID=UPI00333B62D1